MATDGDGDGEHPPYPVDLLELPAAVVPAADGPPKAEGTAEASIAVAPPVDPLEAARHAEAVRLGLRSSLAAVDLDGFLRDGLFFAHEPDLVTLLGAEGAEQRAELVRGALLALRTNRPQDAVDLMNHAAMVGSYLCCSERALFVCSTLRVTTEAKLSISKLAVGNDQEQSVDEQHILARYIKLTELKMKDMCLAQLGVIEKYLLPCSIGESTITYLRLKGHLLELMSKVDPCAMFLLRALSAYVAATEKAEQQLCPSNPQRILAFVDLTSFLEGMHDPESAYEIAWNALNEADSALLSSAARMSAESKFTFNLLGNHVRRLSSKVIGLEDLVPLKVGSRRIKVRDLCTGSCSNCGPQTQGQELHGYKVGNDEEEDHLCAQAVSRYRSR